MLITFPICRSGQSIFSRPRPIDLSAARRAGFSTLDLDLPDDAEEELSRAARGRNPILFDADDRRQNGTGDEERGFARPAVNKPKPPQYDDRDPEDVWASLG